MLSYSRETNISTEFEKESHFRKGMVTIISTKNQHFNSVFKINQFSEVASIPSYSQDLRTRSVIKNIFTPKKKQKYQHIH